MSLARASRGARWEVPRAERCVVRAARAWDVRSGSGGSEVEEEGLVEEGLVEEWIVAFAEDWGGGEEVVVVVGGVAADMVLGDG